MVEGELEVVNQKGEATVKGTFAVLAASAVSRKLRAVLPAGRRKSFWGALRDEACP